MTSAEEDIRERLRREADQAPDDARVRQRVMAEVAELEASRPTRSKTLLIPLAVAAAIMAIAGGTVYVANGVLSSDDIGPAGHEALRDNNSCVIDDAPSTYTWLDGNETQASVERVGNLLRSEYGGHDSLANLRRGLIGTAIDDANQRLVVVVDPSVVDQQQLQRRLTTAAGQSLVVTVAAGCHPVQDLIDARQKLASETRNVVLDLSPYDSTWHVRLDPTDRDLGDHLVDQFGAVVTVEYAVNPGGVRF